MRTIPLVCAKPDTIINFMMDASDIAIGAVLQQHLGVFSKKLSPTEQCYCTFDHALLASFQLEACEFYVLTDRAINIGPQLQL